MLGRSGVEGNKRGLAPGNGGSRGGPRDTRFRYPGQVSGPADEEICFKEGDWLRGGGVKVVLSGPVEEKQSDSELWMQTKLERIQCVQ